MEKFAEYSFNKSHSTAYALITYQTAYLKTHYPAEFMAALMSVESGNTDKVISSITECKQMGIPVLAPDVNVSLDGFTASNGSIRFGLAAIKNVGEGTVDAIISARKEKGKFSSIFDFCENVEARKLNRRTFESLIKSGAFDSLGVNRASLMESLDMLLSYTSIRQKSSVDGQHSLFSLNDAIALEARRVRRMGREGATQKRDGHTGFLRHQPSAYEISVRAREGVDYRHRVAPRN
ncbi:MAG: hypothetical protein R3B51_13785 [Thermodesulfobacteriota bacterium]